MLARADKRQRIGLVDQALQAFDLPLGLAVAHEVAQAANDLAGTDRLLRRFVHGFADHRERLWVRFALEQVARALAVARDGGQRLVELVRQRRGERSHLAHTADVRELGLQVLEPEQGLLPFGEVADEAGEDPLPVDPRLADRRARSERYCRRDAARW